MRYAPRLITALFFGFAAAGVAAEPAAGAEKAGSLPGWLAGRWCHAEGDRLSEEQWLPAAGELMLGLSRSTAPGKKTQFEFLRIELIEGTPVYLAQPGGRPATAFKQVDASQDWVRFSNPEHDFPQHIEYRRSGSELKAIISGPGREGKPMSIEFAYQTCAS